MLLDIGWSRRIAEQIEAEKKACWYNAMRAMMTLDELQKGYYVEGWCIPNTSIPIEHGWIELEKNGVAILLDPTLVLVNSLNNIYYAGIRYTHQQIQTFWNKTLPHAHADHHGGMSYEPYKKAYFQALSYSFPEQNWIPPYI